MPVITVTAPALDSSEAELRALSRVAVEVAAALGLSAEDVHVSCVHSANGVLGQHAVAPWPIVAIHGSRRADGRMTDAAARARDVVADEWRRPSAEVWVLWLVA